MTNIKITKMHGCGNDFVFMDYEEYTKTGMTLDKLSKQLCDRHFGIGADGLIIPVPYDGNDADIEWRYYNSDGTTAQMCGNGMRCFAKYVYDKGLVNKKSFSVKTLAGIKKPEILDNGLIKVNMGKPILKDEEIPFCYLSPRHLGEGAVACEVTSIANAGEGKYTITTKDRTFKITPVSMGNPHCVIFTDNTPIDMAQKYGPELEKHPYFPQKTNVEFVKVISKTEIEMAVFERGCGITLACGTGACASVVASVLNNLTYNNVKVNLPGGVVNIEWEGSKDSPNHDIFLIGPAQYTFNADFMM